MMSTNHGELLSRNNSLIKNLMEKELANGVCELWPQMLKRCQGVRETLSAFAFPCFVFGRWTESIFDS